jgi:hypothetical protein
MVPFVIIPSREPKTTVEELRTETIRNTCNEQRNGTGILQKERQNNYKHSSHKAVEKGEVKGKALFKDIASRHSNLPKYADLTRISPRERSS